jgi:hypothetical protein
MAEIEDDTKGGFNSFLDDQRQEEGAATVSLYDFNSTVNLVYEGRPIEEATELGDDNYAPGGRTALHDALSLAINETAQHIESMPPATQPDTVIVVVLTDGKENASETSQGHVRKLVEYHREIRGWEFLFIGANQDAALTASKVGMDESRALSMDHSPSGTREAYESTSRLISNARKEGSTSGFDDADRRRQKEARDDRSPNGR